MTRDDIIRMAREADPLTEDGWLYRIAMLTPETLERFATLVAQAEREECAKVCEGMHILTSPPHVAAAIRARGNA